MHDTMERETHTGGTHAGKTHAGEGYGTAAKAIMGVAAGAVGTWALDRTDWRMWNHESEKARIQTNAVRPFGEPPAHVLASKVERRLGLDPTPEQHELAGVVTHYGIGIAPAAIYAVVRDKLPGEGPLRGALYGLGLFLIQDEVVNAVSGLGAPPRKYPWQAHARGLVSHVVYGVVTELVLEAMDRSIRARRPGQDTGGEPQGQPRAIRD